MFILIYLSPIFIELYLFQLSPFRHLQFTIIDIIAIISSKTRWTLQTFIVTNLNFNQNNFPAIYFNLIYFNWHDIHQFIAWYLLSLFNFRSKN